MNTTKKLLSLLLALAMVLGLCSINVFAEPAEVTTADIYIVAQLSGGFLAPPQVVEVSSDLSEKYGFEDEVDGVSVLDALIKEHELVFGSDFTKDTASDYLEVSNGSATKEFGISSSTYFGGFLVNEGYPNDGTASPYGTGYNGTTYTTHKLVSGDKVDFFFYEDTYWGDTYTWIDGDLSTLPGDDLEVTVTGTMVMAGYMYKTPEEFKESGEEIEDASFAWVSEDGAITGIEGVYTDEDGEASIPIPDDMEPGIYYLTVLPESEEYMFLCIMNPTPVNIGNIKTTYVSISQNADFVETKDGQTFNRLPVTISGKYVYTIDDVLSAAHKEYADEDHGYESGESFYGLSILKLWGDTSGAFGYYQNDNSSWSLDDEVTEGDFISAFIYKDQDGWSDTYTKFEEISVSTNVGDETEFTLLKYDWVTNSFIPCEGVAIGVSKLADTSAVTDADGKATLTFPAVGTYTVVAKSADAPVIVPSSCTVTVVSVAVTDIDIDNTLTVYENKSKQVGYGIAPTNATDKSVSWESSDNGVATVSEDGLVTGVKAGTATITAKTNDGGFSDSCEVTVKAIPSALDIMHGIAAKYAENGIANDINAPWFAADLAAYKKAFPDTENVLSDEQVQEYLDKLIPASAEATKAGDLAKCIIALRALGFDPENIITSDFSSVNIVEKLHKLIEDENAAVKSIYTLPYVIIAMNEDETYLSADDTAKLISYAIDQKNAWQDNSWGVDTAAAMLLALSPLYDTNEEVKAAADETIEMMKNAQYDDGSFGNASSTGLAVAALSAYGINCSELKKEDMSALEGLAINATDTLDGFNPASNSFGTEQGFRGLVANQLSGSSIYDFSDNPKNTAQATWGENCPVTFVVTPDTAEITVECQDAVSDGKYDLPAGTYNYTVSQSGFKTAGGTFAVTDADAENHTPKTINVSLEIDSSSSDSGVLISVTDVLESGNPVVSVSADNRESTTQDALLFLAFYGETGRVIDIKCADISLAPNEIKSDISFMVPDGALSYRVFLWNKVMHPLCGTASGKPSDN
ncbi:MAG: Ig-like domain-containing protein [Clostridia bacterium]|nr:Ig-like domain-containing protein [Clostridia bacterium]